MIDDLSVPRVVITRPVRQSYEWAEKIRDASIGLEISIVPCLEIEPVDADPKIHAIKDKIQRLNEYSILIFVSQNAVKYGFDWIEDFWPQFPMGIVCLGIGTKTQKAIQKRLDNLVGRTEAPSSPSGMNTPSLLDHEALRQVVNQKILIMRGLGGLPQLQQDF